MAGQEPFTTGYAEGCAERRYPEPGKQPGRTAFQRDRARIQHSEALRRLADVTQVMPPQHRGRPWDPAPRTRLTHSLECAQIGRDLATALGCDSDLVEAACLAHDLGHPPFGHVGEQALAELTAEMGGFEANAQTLRLLTRLEPRYLTTDPATGHPTSAGLNLTRATLDATCKYPWPRAGHPTRPGSRKFGVYDEDRPVFGWLRAQSPAPYRRCFEAQVMDWADDIAYCVHDFEDGLRAGHVDPVRLADPVEQQEIISLAAAPGRYTPPGTDRHELADALGRLTAQSWWPHRYEDSPRGHALLKHATAQLVGRFCHAAETATRSTHGPGPLTRYNADLIIPGPVRMEAAVLKAVTALYVMRRPAQLRLRTTQQELLAELAQALLVQAPHSLAPVFQHQFLQATNDRARTRAVIDQISVLTDTHAHALHAQYMPCPVRPRQSPCAGPTPGPRASPAPSKGSTVLTRLLDRLSVIELRQYILLPGRRKEFVDLFDKELIESQEAAGIAVLGQFTDAEDPDRIVWLRGFADMRARHQALTTFYDSPAWHQFGHLAVAPKKPDLDDILLLRPLQQDQPVPFTPAGRLPLGAPTPQRDVTITVWFFAPGSDRGPSMIRDTLLPRLRETDPIRLLALATEPARNTFPQLPVRTGVSATVVLTTHPAQHAPATHPADLAATMIPDLTDEQAAPTQILRLTPTSRSVL